MLPRTEWQDAPGVMGGDSGRWHGGGTGTRQRQWWDAPVAEDVRETGSDALRGRRWWQRKQQCRGGQGRRGEWLGTGHMEQINRLSK